MRRNSVYVAFVLGGAMVGERVSGKEKGGREGNARSLPHPLLTRRPPSSSLSP